MLGQQPQWARTRFIQENTDCHHSLLVTASTIIVCPVSVCKHDFCKKALSHFSDLSYVTLNNIVTLKSGLEVTQGHSNLYNS